MPSSMSKVISAVAPTAARAGQWRRIPVRLAADGTGSGGLLMASTYVPLRGMDTGIAGSVSPHSVRPELDADARSGGPGGLGDAVFPGPLAGTAHHDQVAVPQWAPYGLAPTRRAQQ